MIRWDDSNYLMHYGMPRRSGRYPWGSGKNPYHHNGDVPYPWGKSKFSKERQSSTNVIAKGSSVYRTDVMNPDYLGKLPITSGKMKYVSTNEKDSERWHDYFENQYDKKGVTYAMQDTTLTAKKDIKVMSAEEAAELYYNKFIANKHLEKKTMRDVEDYLQLLNNRKLRYNPKAETITTENFKDKLNFDVNKDPTDVVINRLLASSLALRQNTPGFGAAAYNHKTSNKFIKEILKTKMSAVEDYYGRDISANPTIILKPEKNLQVSKARGEIKYRY